MNTKKLDILELRERAKKELLVLFGKKPADQTESDIMYLVGLYQMGVDTLSLAVGLKEPDYEHLYPSEPGNDVTEESEEQKAERRWKERLK